MHILRSLSAPAAPRTRIFLRGTKAMQQSFVQWKRRKLHECSEKPAEVTLCEGLRVKMANWKPERVQAYMRDLTFTPRAVFDAGVPPALICCYQVQNEIIVLPRCYRGLNATVVDELSDGEPRDLTFAGSLNEMQVCAFDKSCTALRRAPHACILTLPCGFGKTVVALSIAAALGRKTLVVVHKENLLEQWRERIKTFLPGARTGVIQQSRSEFKDVDVSLAMLQTVCARELPPDCLDSFGTVVLDEAHHLAAPYFSQLFFRLRCRHILGLTATPKRKDGCTDILHLFMGDFSFQLAARVDGDVKVFIEPWRTSFRCSPDPLPPEVQRYKTRLASDQLRNHRILELCTQASAAGRNIICLSDRVEHLKKLRQQWDERSPLTPAAFFIGGRSKENLQERGLAQASASLIFATFAMASEGLDIPRLDTLILCTPVGDVTQAVGRILRPCAEKKTPVIVDICDDGCVAFARLAAIRKGCFERSAFQVLSGQLPDFE
jgi:superfamily II DNA or RNA helicase